MSVNKGLAALILAAGHGKRMKSDLPKVLHEVGGKPMISHVIDQARSCGAEPIIAVVGHKRELVIDVIEREGVGYDIQEEQLGTGHAVQSAEKHFKNYEGNVLVLSGDVPLLTRETISNVVEYHNKENAVVTVITAIAPDPTGYGRVLRGNDGNVEAIREHKDCSDTERQIDEINSGIYVFSGKPLFEALSKLDNNNAQGEYYITDVFAQYFKQKMKVAAIVADFDEIHGVNNIDDLKKAENIWSSRHEKA